MSTKKGSISQKNHRGHSVDIYLRQRNFVQRHRDLPLRVSILISQRGFHLWRNYLEVRDNTYFWKNDALSKDNIVGTLLSSYGLA